MVNNCDQFTISVVQIVPQMGDFILKVGSSAAKNSTKSAVNHLLGFTLGDVIVSVQH
jgi:hypothetical protein